MSDVEKIVRDFYDNFGWVEKHGGLGEDSLFRYLSPPYYPYHKSVKARTMKCFEKISGKLLIAGGGDLRGIHSTIAQKFSATTCLDISYKSLEIAKRKLKHKGEFILGSILDIPKAENYFDAAYCAHVIFHIDRAFQAKAVRELIRAIRPGGLIVIIYANPDSLPLRIVKFKERIPLLRRIQRKKSLDKIDTRERPPLYYFAYPLKWWSQFKDECDLELIPWDVMGNTEEKQILVNDAIAWLVYRFCSWFEDKHPKKAVQWWSYPIITLRKKSREDTLHRSALSTALDLFLRSNRV